MKNKKNFIIVGLLVAIVFMSVGYAALAQNLDIFGTAKITGTWAVDIIEITDKNMVGAETVTTNFDTTSATFEVNLAYPGATASYDVVVKNNGKIPAKLENILGLEAANGNLPEEIQYAVTGVNVGTKLAAGATNTATITVTWVAKDDNTDVIPSEKTKIATITLSYVQDTD